MSIRKKLLILLVPIMLILMVLIGFWSTKTLAKTLINTSRLEAVKQTENMAWLVKKQMIHLDLKSSYESTLKAYLQDLIREDEQFVVWDKNRKKVISVSSDTMSFFSDDHVSRTESTQSVFTRIDGKIILTVSTQIKILGEDLIFNRSVDVSHLDETYKQYTLRALTFYIVMFLLVISVSLHLSKEITQPIEKLAMDIKLIKNEGFNRNIESIEIEELKQVGQAFNDLMNEVEARHLKLMDERDIRQNFIDSLRHEMRTPLTSIIGYSGLLKSKILSKDEENQSIQTIYNEASRLQAMSDSLLYGLMARTEIEKTEVDTSKLIKDLLKTYRIALNEKNIKLNPDLLIAKISAEPILVFQALGNLIDNAIRASSINSEIKVTVTCEGIVVQDYGCGMLESGHIKNVRTEGFGLGLHIVREIALAHDWTFEISNGQDCGVVAKLLFNG